MIKAIHQSARNLHLKMRNMEIVAQNLANINTQGYKRELPFSELVNRFQDGRYTQVTDFSQGSLNATGNPLDIAINGGGFFVIETQKGPMLTRKGNFTISDDGLLVTQQGERVMGYEGYIDLSEALFDKTKDITFNTNGDIRIGDQLVGKLKIAKVRNQVRLDRFEENKYFSETLDYLVPDESEYTISQGYLEQSNVNPVQEMQEMITLSKDYEASQRLIGAWDASYGRANEIGRV